jgi:hypothetical protein
VLWLPSESLYTAEDLIRVARARGFEPTKRLITDWTSIGLLDQPQRHSRGRARGIKRVWPERQLKLWLTLLEKRREVTHVAALCNLPVFLWLYLGPDYAPVRQVRRALTHFNRRLLAGPSTEARLAAKRLIDQVGAPNASQKDRKALVDAIVRATGGGGFNREALLEAVRPVFDPDGQGRQVGPPGAVMTADSWVNVTEATVVGAHTIKTLPEEDFEAARLAHHQHMRTYMARHAQLARDPEIGTMFEDPTDERLVNDACQHITTLIGFLELARRRGGRQPEAAAT